MRKLRVVFDGGHGLYIHVNVFADTPTNAHRIAIEGIEKHFPQYAGVLSDLPTRYYDASDAPSDTVFLSDGGVECEVHL